MLHYNTACPCSCISTVILSAQRYTREIRRWCVCRQIEESMAIFCIIYLVLWMNKKTLTLRQRRQKEGRSMSTLWTQSVCTDIKFVTNASWWMSHDINFINIANHYSQLLVLAITIISSMTSNSTTAVTHLRKPGKSTKNRCSSCGAVLFCMSGQACSWAKTRAHSRV